MKWKNYKCKKLSKKNLDKIIVSKAFKEHPPKQDKLTAKVDCYLKTGKFSPIIVDEDYILVDGYCSWMICNDFPALATRHSLKIYKAKGLHISKSKKEQ